MAKHPHKLLFMSKKTWKCTLPGCTFFVHLGLMHVLVGKQAICWECEEQFTLDAHALTEDKPRCDECRTGLSDDKLAEYINSKLNKDKE